MTFDPQVPGQLKEIQSWFGSIIGRRMDPGSCMMSVSPSGVAMSEEASIYIRPSPTLKPEQRIQIYNQQYWWRLLSIMQDNFPLVTRLFGYAEFNVTISEPYLEKYPPRHWSLNILGDRLLYWMEEEYLGDNRELVKNAAALDHAYLMCFLTSEKSPINFLDTPLEDITEEKLSLQPHLFLFTWDYDLITLRQEMLKESPDYWVDHDFPVMNKSEQFNFVLYRNKVLNVYVERIDALEFEVLKLFQQGMSIDGFCEWIESQQASKAEKAEASLQHWFQSWTAKCWLVLA